MDTRHALLVWQSGNITQEWFRGEALEKLLARKKHVVSRPRWRDMNERLLDQAEAGASDATLILTVDYVFVLTSLPEGVTLKDNALLLAEWGAPEPVKAAQAYSRGFFLRKVRWQDGHETEIEVSIELAQLDAFHWYDPETGSKHYLAKLTSREPPTYFELSRS